MIESHQFKMASSCQSHQQNKRMNTDPLTLNMATTPYKVADEPSRLSIHWPCRLTMEMTDQVQSLSCLAKLHSNWKRLVAIDSK